jgi:hypothetical protein
MYVSGMGEAHTGIKNIERKYCQRKIKVMQPEEGRICSSQASSKEICSKDVTKTRFLRAYGESGTTVNVL